MAFIPSFRESQQKQSNYRQWSERATIVSYDAGTRTYDVVVTAMGPTGTQISNTNRALRKIKSLFPDSVGNFSPGDSVLLGYVSEQREHPIILGAGDHVAPTINTPVVTLPTATDPASVEGPSNGITDAVQVPACPPRINTGTTNSGEFVVNCEDLNLEGVYDVPLQALCITSGVSWGWNIPGGATQGTLLIEGVNNNRVKLKLPNPGSASPGVAFRRDLHSCLFCGGPGNAQCTAEGTIVSELYGCNDALQGCTTTSSCGLPFPGSPSSLRNCCPTTPTCPDLDLSVCGSPQGILDTSTCDVRTPDMLAAGCSPCRLAHNTVLTAQVGDFVANIVVKVFGAQ